MQPEITPKQQRLLRYLEKEIPRTGACPSLRRAATALGVSHTAVAQLLRALEEKGYVKREGRYSRNLYVLNRVSEAAGFQRWKEIPIVGSVQAGLPMYAQQQWDGSIVVDISIYRGANLFGLRIQGDSMKDSGIFDGDLAICEPRQYARDGEIVVALIGREEATVKRFFLHKDRVELRPDNPRYVPLFYGFGEVLIQGKVIGIFRGPEVLDRM
jgi:repressor LexA